VTIARSSSRAEPAPVKLVATRVFRPERRPWGFFSEEGKFFEAGGIPPDFAVDVFPSTDLKAGKDAALDKALALLAASK
jgi:hypothetical protein